MTEENLSDQVREIIGKMHHHANDPYVGSSEKRNIVIFAQQLAALLPPRPTLAGMTREERAECRWMQADVKGRSTRYVIATPSDRNGLAGLVSADGVIEWTYPERVTPRPDLPRLEWPGTGQGTGDATPVKVGDVIESADDPRLAALPAGSVLLDRDGVTTTKREEGRWAGFGHKPIPSQGDEYGPWTVRRIGLVADQ